MYLLLSDFNSVVSGEAGVCSSVQSCHVLSIPSLCTPVYCWTHNHLQYICLSGVLSTLFSYYWEECDKDYYRVLSWYLCTEAYATTLLAWRFIIFWVSKLRISAKMSNSTIHHSGLSLPLWLTPVFNVQLENVQRAYSIKDIAIYGLRWFLCFLLMEFLTHQCYFNALAIRLNPEPRRVIPKTCFTVYSSCRSYNELFAKFSPFAFQSLILCIGELYESLKPL